jgi:signal transduction histidine kinase
MASRSPAQIERLTEMEVVRLETFMSRTIHNLREPFRTMQIYGQLLEEGKSGPANQEMLELFRNASRQMQELLDGLAEFASAGTASGPQPSLVRLDLPLQQALLNLDGEIKARGASVSYDELPKGRVRFDKLQQVFCHLIRNALQYCGSRPPKVTVSARPSELDWVVEVRDNGCGIAPEFQNRIFDPYSRLHEKGVSGAGLGLAICRLIVESHGGRIWVESTPGEGSAFFFTVPRTEPAR